MSSTARGATRSPGDYYRTPGWCIEEIVPFLDEPSCILDPGCGDGAIGAALKDRFGHLLILGTEIDSALASKASKAGAYDAVHHADFLQASEGRLAEDCLIIGNPPYSLAMEFVQRSFELVRETGGGGTVCFLLRLPWLASMKRRRFHQESLTSAYVLPRRPSFCWSHTYQVTCSACLEPARVKRSVAVGEPAISVDCPIGNECKACGESAAIVREASTTTTDSCDYAWFVWDLDGDGHPCGLQRLAIL